MIIGIFAIAVMGLSAFGVQKSLNSNAEVSQLTLDNLEALAWEEGDGDNEEVCSNYNICYSRSRVKVGWTLV